MRLGYAKQGQSQHAPEPPCEMKKRMIRPFQATLPIAHVCPVAQRELNRSYFINLPTASCTTLAASPSPISIAAICTRMSIATSSSRRCGFVANESQESQTFGDSRRISKFESPDGGRETPEGVAIGGEPFSETSCLMLFAACGIPPSEFKIPCCNKRPGSIPSGATRLKLLRI